MLDKGLVSVSLHQVRTEALHTSWEMLLAFCGWYNQVRQNYPKVICIVLSWACKEAQRIERTQSDHWNYLSWALGPKFQDLELWVKSGCSVQQIPSTYIKAFQVCADSAGTNNDLNLWSCGIRMYMNSLQSSSHPLTWFPKPPITLRAWLHDYALNKTCIIYLCLRKRSFRKVKINELNPQW